MAEQDRALDRWEQTVGLTHLSRGERHIARLGFREGYATAEVEVRALREALGEAGIVLEALNIAGGTALTKEIANAVDIICRVLAPEPAEDAPAPAGGA